MMPGAVLLQVSDMLPIVLFVLGSATIALQETTAEGPFSTSETNPATYTTVQLTSTDETIPTFQTTLAQNTFAGQVSKLRNDPGCKNQFICVFQRKSTLSKGYPPVPSKNLVPPYTDSEEEELKTTEASKTTLNEAETESVFPTTSNTRATSVRSVKIPLQKRGGSSDGDKAKPEASNELKSYLPPANLASSAAQVDLSYLPPKGVLPAAAAASLDIARVNYLPPEEVKPAAAQTDFRQVKPETPQKDICSDAFHSFLCTPLKSRTRITGALPNGSAPNPAASNTIQSAVSTARPTVSTPTRQTYKPFSTKATTPARTVPGYAPQPSNVDRSYLPPASKSFAASSSFNSINVVKVNQVTAGTRKPFPTSTPRPVIQTSATAYVSPKVFEQINHTPGRPKATTPVPRLLPEPSNESNRNYLPPSTQFIQKSSALPTFRERTPSLQRVTAATKVAVTTPTPNASYLPPSPKIEPAAAAQFSQAVAPANRIAVPHHDHHDGHHGKDICSDPFHSFLCAPLKQRKRITGALPPGYNPQSSNRKETRVKPQIPVSSSPRPDNAVHSQKRTKPAEEVPAANILSPQAVKYQNPKPSASQPTAGYQYPKPSIPFLLPSESRQDRPSAFPVPSPSAPVPSATQTSGYQYPKPSNPFLLPSESQQNRPSAFPIPSPSTTTPSPKPQNIGYQYPKPTIPFLLPSESRQSQPSTFSKPISTPAPSLKPQPSNQRIGYQYPKPSIPFFLPSESQQSNPSTPKPLQPQPSGQIGQIDYPYTKPTQQPTSSGGYRYPKPVNQLLLPTEVKSSDISPSPKDLGSAEFIPVNKIDSKRQVRTGVIGGSPRFGDRIRIRVRQASPAS